jgi:hypothetical protein
MPSNARLMAPPPPSYYCLRDAGALDKAFVADFSKRIFPKVVGAEDRALGRESPAVIKGIGPETADKLKRARLGTVEKLAATDRDLSKSRVDFTARDLTAIAGARAALNSCPGYIPPNV